MEKVHIITEFRTDRNTKFIFGGGVAGFKSISANIGSDREIGNGATNLRL